MKAKHRHELKTNILAEWLGNLPQWTKENLMMIIVVSVIAVAAIGAYFYFGYQRKRVLEQQGVRLMTVTTQLAQTKRDILGQQTRGNDISYLLLELAKSLEGFASGAKSSNSAAFAYIKHAEAYRAELHYRPLLVSMRDLNDQTNQAKASYAKALDLAGTASLKATAQFGLGLCEEELGNFDVAEGIYREIVANADFEPTTAYVQARQRLETLSHYKQKVVFKTAPKSEVPSRTQPRMPRFPGDANIGSTLRPDQVGARPRPPRPKPVPTPGTNVLPALVPPVDTNAAANGSSGS